eukprot:gene13547-13674_t
MTYAAAAALERPPALRQQANTGRRLSAAVHAKRNVGSSAPAKQQRNLTGHWHHSNSYRPGPYDIWGSDIGDKRCASLDTPLGQGPRAEAIPWGVKAIGAWNMTLQSQPAKGRAIVCIIDSGLWLEHPEYLNVTTSSTGSSLDGCSTGPNCPFDWYQDLVGHGTHVAGTIGAPQNGLGVVGVISKGLDIHVVRIWNDSGDVSQGQGPYATDLVLAYDNCLSKLKSEQAKSPGKKVNMVINMSYGSAGPLTVERLWIQQAASRGDVLLVASAGNNGSFLMDPLDFYQADMPPGKKVDAGQYLSYPASYNLSEVLSVANYRCDGNIDFTSQKNRAVGIAAPGMSILSSVPKAYGAIRAHVATSLPLPNQTGTPRPPSSPSAAAPQSSQGAASLPPVFGTTRGGGPGKPGQRNSGFGYTSEGYREPRPIMGTQVGSTGLRKLVLCNISADVRAAAFGRQEPPQQPAGGLCAGAQNAVCLVELPGNIDWYYETCLAMIKCVKSGGKGLIVWREDKLLSGMFLEPDPLDLGGSVDEFLLGTQINCGTKCPCWGQLRKALDCEQGECNQKAPPGIVVSAKHANALLKVSKAAQARTSQQQQSADPLLVDVTVYEYNYRHYDGTSMAAPHVSGAAGLLWRLFPDCKARDIADALKSSAQRLVQDQKSADGRDWAAGSGLLKVDRAYDWIQRNNKCAQK